MMALRESSEVTRIEMVDLFWPLEIPMPETWRFVLMNVIGDLRKKLRPFGWSIYCTYYGIEGTSKWTLMNGDDNVQDHSNFSYNVVGLLIGSGGAGHSSGVSDGDDYLRS